MNFRNYLLPLATMAVLSVGQVLFKLSAAGASVSRPTSLLRPTMICALVIYGIATVMWIYVLKKTPLSTAFAFYGLTFLLVPIFSKYLLHEKVNVATFIGGVIILLGVLISQVKL